MDFQIFILEQKNIMKKTNTISLPGKIHFDPTDKTKKHISQSSWKKMALILFDGDVSEYYSWFIERRYNLKLNKPLRGAHISFFNDSVNDLKIANPNKDIQKLWNDLSLKWNNKIINVQLDTDVRSDGEHWWLNIPEECRKPIHDIRAEIGLGRPFFGLHMTIGTANEKNLFHSNYILNLIRIFND